MPWTAAGAVVLAVLAGCDRPARDPRPPAPPSDTRQVVAVVTASGALALFRLDAAGHSVTDPLPLNGPPSAKATSVSLSGAASPRVCAVWRAGEQRTVVCYAAGRSDGVPVAAAASPSRVAVSASGRSIAWVSDPNDDDGDTYNQDIVVGRLDDAAAVSEVRTLPARPPGSPPAMLGPSADEIAWRGDDALVVSTGFQSDDGTGLTDVSVADAERGGWSAGRLVRSTSADRKAGFGVFELARTPTEDGDVVAVQRGSYGTGDPPSRAVVLDLRTGATRRIIALAATDRFVVSVSGSARGWVYQTEGGDLKTYLRLPSDQRGVPLAGLPADTALVLAQT